MFYFCREKMFSSRLILGSWIKKLTSVELYFIKPDFPIWDFGHVIALVWGPVQLLYWRWVNVSLLSCDLPVDSKLAWSPWVKHCHLVVVGVDSVGWYSGGHPMEMFAICMEWWTDVIILDIWFFPEGQKYRSGNLRGIPGQDLGMGNHFP